MTLTVMVVTGNGTAWAQLIQHLDASVSESILTGGQGAVTQWTDQSGSGNHGLPFAGAVYKTTDGDHTWLDFGSARNALELFTGTASAGWLDCSDGSGGFSVFVVLKVDDLHTDWNDMLGNTSAALGQEGFGMRWSNSGTIQNYLAGVKLESSNVSPGDVVLFWLNYDAAAGEAIFWDSKHEVQVTEEVPPIDFSLSAPVTLGTTSNSGRYMIGSVGEVKIYQNSLSQSDFQQEKTQLLNKWLASENDPPAPDPATFAEPPAVLHGTTITMTATTGTDASGGVSYLFEETSGNPGGDDSGWQPYPYYSDGGLEPGTQYSYRVTLRDDFGNTGQPSQVYAATAGEAPPTEDDLDYGAYYGYQAWHRGPEEGWPHWFDNGVPDAEHMSGDNWPDLSEYPILYETELEYPDGSPVSVYSTNDYETVDVHIRWMKEYGIKGCYVQRQQLHIDDPVQRAYMDRKAMYVRRACEKYGVKFCIMPCNNDKTDGGRGEEYIDAIIADWKHCVDDLKITESPMYMHQDGKPVIGFWGLGFNNRDMTPEQATRILDFFQSPEDPRYQVYVMGGLHHFWRVNPKEGWIPVYERLDMISPWRTIFYDAYSQNHIDRMNDDKAWCDARNIDYNPVVSPGASTAYQNGPENRNNFPRDGGHYLWKQLYEVCKMGNPFIYVAMYDEIDEGTAMYKLAENQSQCPVVDPPLVPLDEDGYTLPGDWYLRVGTEMQKMLEGTIELTPDLPISPFTPQWTPDPADGATGVQPWPVMAWQGTSQADSFHVYLARETPELDENDRVSTVTEYTYTPPEPLENGATYYWRLDTFIDGNRYTGTVWSFTVEPLGVENLPSGPTIYPNPARNTLYVTGTDGEIPYRINTITGYPCLSGTAREGATINISHLQKGVYLLHIGGQPVKLIKN